MKKGFTLVLILLLLATVVLTGCGNSGNAPASESSTAPEGQVNIKFVSWFSYVTQDLIDLFEKENPGIKVDYEYVAPGDGYSNKIRTLSSSKNMPDLFATQGVDYTALAENNLIMDLSSELSTPAYDTGTAWGETINPVLMDNMNELTKDSPKIENAQDKTFGIPFGAISTAVVYNKSIFSEVGISEPATFEEFLSNNDKLKQAGYIPLSFTGKVFWFTWWFSLAADQYMRDVKPDDFKTGAVKYTDPSFVKILTTLKDMWDRGHFDPGGFSNGIEETQALFVQQKLAQFFIVPENFVKFLQDNKPSGVELGAFALPAMNGIEPNRGVGGAANILAVSATTKNKEAVMKLAKFLTSNQLFALLAPEKVVPSTVGYMPPEGDSIMGAFAKAAENGFAPNHLDLPTEVNLKFQQDWFPGVMLNKWTPQEAAELLQKAYEDERKKAEAEQK